MLDCPLEITPSLIWTLSDIYVITHYCFFTEKTSSKPKTVTEIISPVSPSVVAAPEFAEYENMYKRGEWNCYMCSKWFSRYGIK